MTAHIDVYVNDWSRGRQRVVARVRLNEGEQLDIEVLGEAEYREVILAPIVDPIAGTAVTPDEPVEFFKHLPHAFTGSYLGATQPHNGDCPFGPAGEALFKPTSQDVVL